MNEHYSGMNVIDSLFLCVTRMQAYTHNLAYAVMRKRTVVDTGIFPLPLCIIFCFVVDFDLILKILCLIIYCCLFCSVLFDVDVLAFDACWPSPLWPLPRVYNVHLDVSG